LIHENGVIDALLFIAVLAPSIILHEVAHGVIAARLGDPTARDAGRLTLNPAKHIDPFGSIILPAMLALGGQNVFGWAKPVPVNPHRFAHPTRGMAVTALAGPAANLMLALAVGRFGPFDQLRGVVCFGDVACLTSNSLWARVLFGFLVVNAALAVFNMLPIPPLDGSRLLPLVLSDAGRQAYARLSQYGFLILVLLLFVFEDSLSFLGDWIGWIIRLAV
jgi:Zn-dependent protease